MRTSEESITLPAQGGQKGELTCGFVSTHSVEFEVVVKCQESTQNFIATLSGSINYRFGTYFVRLTRLFRRLGL